jgi:SAM-dependent methyltransferase
MSDSDGFEPDLERIRRHYAEVFLPSNAWATLDPYPYLCLRQRQRRLRDVLIECGLGSAERLGAVDVLDVGCGQGSTLAWLIELGARPERSVGVDLVESRIRIARERYAGVRWIAGDFLAAGAGGPFDLVLLVAVLSSIVNAKLKARIVERCFELLRPGGVFVFYDLVGKREKRGSETFKPLTFDEVARYAGGRRMRWFEKSYLRRDVAERIVPRLGVTAAELVQATRLFNIDAAFGWTRA